MALEWWRDLDSGLVTRPRQRVAAQAFAGVFVDPFVRRDLDQPLPRARHPAVRALAYVGPLNTETSVATWGQPLSVLPAKRIALAHFMPFTAEGFTEPEEVPEQWWADLSLPVQLFHRSLPPALMPVTALGIVPVTGPDFPLLAGFLKLVLAINSVVFFKSPIVLPPFDWSETYSFSPFVIPPQPFVTVVGFDPARQAMYVGMSNGGATVYSPVGQSQVFTIVQIARQGGDPTSFLATLPVLAT